MKVEILVGEITGLVTKTRVEGDAGLLTTLQFTGKIPPAAVARLINLQQQGAPLYAAIGSSQAVMDLNFSQDQVPGQLQLSE